jgi:tellurite resistance protein TerC
MWGAFGMLMVVMLAIDLGMNRKAHGKVSSPGADLEHHLGLLALAFNVGIYAFLGQNKAL